MKRSAPARALNTILGSDLATLDRLRKESRRSGPSAEDVHDARVALRRVAALLDVLDGELAGDTGAAVKELRNASRTFCASRDATVWLALLESKPIARKMEAEAKWAAYVRRAARQEQAERRKLGHVWQKSLDNATVALAAVMRRNKTVLRPGVLRRLHRTIARRLVRQNAVAVAPLLRRPAKLHAHRRKLRRLRYVARLFENDLSKRQCRQLDNLRLTEATLGRLHDFDVALVRLGGKGDGLSQSLEAIIQEKRSKRSRRML